jgi:Family of unknown function (DUF5305)
LKAAVIVLVVLVLLTAFAAYWVYADQVLDRPAGTAAAPLYRYSELGSYTYVATLRPNSLYNTTTLTQGNGTLFMSLTTWINLTFSYVLTATPSVNATSSASVLVALSSTSWSKSLGTVSASAVASGSSVLTLRAVYDLNATAVIALAESIESQTGYAPGVFQVSFLPTVSTTAGRAGIGSSFQFSAPLSLNFTSGQIVPSALSSSASGSVANPDASATDPAASAWYVLPSSWLLILSLAALMGTAYVVLSNRPTRRAPALSTLVQPYMEAIVDTPAAPAARETVVVQGWNDLVKVADTIGRPILRVVGPGGAPTPVTVFYVLVEGTAYVYRHDSNPSVDPTGGTEPPSSAVAAFRKAYPIIPGADSTSLDSFVLWVDRVNARIRHLPASQAGRQEAEESVLRAVGLAQRGQLDAAWVTLGQANAAVESMAQGAGAPSN